MIKKMLETIKKYNMIENGDKIVIGVSGGADSIALLSLLNELKNYYSFQLFVIHVNHGIRGEEAKRDEIFVKQTCEGMNVPFKAVYYNMNLVAKENKLSPEEAGRKIRYDSFYNHLEEVKGNKIAVAHNLNDVAETVVMRLCRGAGLTGLKGIPAVRGNIIRPLIECSREEIENYLAENKCFFCTDSTNLETDYTRNKIRLELLPYMEKEINLRTIKNIGKTANIIAEEDEFMEKLAKESYAKAINHVKENEISLKIDEIKKIDKVLAKRVIRKALRHFVKDIKNITAKHVSLIIDLMDNNTGKSLNLIDEIVIKKEYNLLKIEKKEEKTLENFCYKLKENEILYIKEAKINVLISKNEKNYNINSQYVYTKRFNYARIEGNIFIRNRKPQDVIYINKNGSKKKIKDFFIDEKIPRDIRNKIALICNDNNSVLWVVGYRSSIYFEADIETENVLYIHIWEEK